MVVGLSMGSMCTNWGLIPSLPIRRAPVISLQKIVPAEERLRKEGKEEGEGVREGGLGVKAMRRERRHVSLDLVGRNTRIHPSQSPLRPFLS